jgi:hypothetical protein
LVDARPDEIDNLHPPAACQNGELNGRRVVVAHRCEKPSLLVQARLADAFLRFFSNWRLQSMSATGTFQVFLARVITARRGTVAVRLTVALLMPLARRVATIAAIIESKWPFERAESGR